MGLFGGLKRAFSTPQRVSARVPIMEDLDKILHIVDKELNGMSPTDMMINALVAKASDQKCECFFDGYETIPCGCSGPLTDARKVMVNIYNYVINGGEDCQDVINMLNDQLGVDFYGIAREINYKIPKITRELTNPDYTYIMMTVADEGISDSPNGYLALDGPNLLRVIFKVQTKYSTWQINKVVNDYQIDFNGNFGVSPDFSTGLKKQLNKRVGDTVHSVIHGLKVMGGYKVVLGTIHELDENQNILEEPYDRYLMKRVYEVINKR